MKLKCEYARFFLIIICCIILSGCSSDDISRNDSSIAMIKNATMSTYGTGFAVGIPGKAVDTIVTSYSVIATSNGAAPTTAEIRINEYEKELSANVAFYDAGRNLAILKLAKGSKELKPLVLKDAVNYDEKVYVRGYDGTGNIISDFEKFNTTDIIQYSGNISTYDELNTMVVYKYSNEFNRALAGAPAIDENGNVVGMCAYSLDSMNTYSQYILSSDELVKCFLAQNIEFITSEEVKYKNIIIAEIIIGLLLFVSIIVAALIIANRNENNLKFKDRYIRITDGTLKGKVYKFNGKLTIGRDETRCDVVYPIDEPGISALHCTVQIKENNYYLIDNFSKYGTFLENGAKITPSLPYKIKNKKFSFYIAEPRNRFEFIDKKEI